MSDPHEAVADADAVGGIIVVGGTGGVDGQGRRGRLVQASRGLQISRR